ncbi:hypothetical protein GGQ64_000837 [Rhizobium azooxidifex]|uniref:Major facilitator superfamily (MFS) profile domain-containing protein n=1 Tax=Mycoplana azooxidifex TaxID=1636188 RepID=A0A7W6GHP5_9HYPH|nr:arsenite efflux MFS transporter ArsK [Mycoplana azooxidifex]MBB3975650.1 hypothetical protein [Mycoplana azooxidifex]
MTPHRLPVGAVLGLGVTQIIGYGTLYYSFSILAPDMARGYGLPVEWMFGALSVALLVGGLVSPSIGGWIDRFGAGRIMAVGSLVAALALIGCAASPNRPSFLVALVVIEVAANFVQYGAAFALLVQIAPNVALRSITYLTLIAGFASTIFWPVTSALHASLSWQQIYLVFAGMNALVCLPVHAWLARTARPVRGNASTTEVRKVEGSLPPEKRRSGFVLMIVGFSLQALVSSAVLVHMVPLLSGLGLGAAAALVGTLFGPAQVASRLINMLLGRDLQPLVLAAISALLMAAAIAVLAATAPSMVGAMGFAVLFGFGSGLFSIVSGTLPLSLFGSEGYGRLQGKITSARLIVSAMAPFAFAIAIKPLGEVLSLSIAAICGSLALLAFLAIGRRAG